MSNSLVSGSESYSIKILDDILSFSKLCNQFQINHQFFQSKFPYILNHFCNKYSDLRNIFLICPEEFIINNFERYTQANTIKLLTTLLEYLVKNNTNLEYIDGIKNNSHDSEAKYTLTAICLFSLERLFNLNPIQSKLRHYCNETQSLLVNLKETLQNPILSNHGDVRLRAKGRSILSRIQLFDNINLEAKHQEITSIKQENKSNKTGDNNQIVKSSQELPIPSNTSETHPLPANPKTNNETASILILANKKIDNNPNTTNIKPSIIQVSSTQNQSKIESVQNLAPVCISVVYNFWREFQMKAQSMYSLEWKKIDTLSQQNEYNFNQLTERAKTGEFEEHISEFIVNFKRILLKFSSRSLTLLEQNSVAYLERLFRSMLPISWKQSYGKYCSTLNECSADYVKLSSVLTQLKSIKLTDLFDNNPSQHRQICSFEQLQTRIKSELYTTEQQFYDDCMSIWDFAKKLKTVKSEIIQIYENKFKQIWDTLFPIINNTQQTSFPMQTSTTNINQLYHNNSNNDKKSITPEYVSHEANSNIMDDFEPGSNFIHDSQHCTKKVELIKTNPKCPNVIRCPLCDHDLRSDFCLSAHLEEIHVRWICFGCNGIFLTEALRNQHFNTIHPKSNNFTEESQCNYCGVWISPEKSMYRSHINNHELKFECDKPNCLSAFPQSYKLNKHVTSKHVFDVDDIATTRRESTRPTVFTFGSNWRPLVTENTRKRSAITRSSPSNQTNSENNNQIEDDNNINVFRTVDNTESTELSVDRSDTSVEDQNKKQKISSEQRTNENTMDLDQQQENQDSATDIEYDDILSVNEEDKLSEIEMLPEEENQEEEYQYEYSPSDEEDIKDRDKIYLFRHYLRRYTKCKEPGCGFKAPTDFHLKQHTENVHNLFFCFIDSYTIPLENIDDINIHRARHTGKSGKYVCDYCSGGFKRNDLLQDHVKNQHEPKFKCDHCTVSECYFPSKKKFREHLISIHPSIPIPTELQQPEKVEPKPKLSPLEELFEQVVDKYPDLAPEAHKIRSGTLLTEKQKLTQIAQLRNNKTKEERNRIKQMELEATINSKELESKALTLPPDEAAVIRVLSGFIGVVKADTGNAVQKEFSYSYLEALLTQELPRKQFAINLEEYLKRDSILQLTEQNSLLLQKQTSSSPDIYFKFIKINQPENTVNLDNNINIIATTETPYPPLLQTGDTNNRCDSSEDIHHFIETLNSQAITSKPEDANVLANINEDIDNCSSISPVFKGIDAKPF